MTWVIINAPLDLRPLYMYHERWDIRLTDGSDMEIQEAKLGGRKRKEVKKELRHLGEKKRDTQ